MKILFWNIGYAPGLSGSIVEYAKNSHRFFSLSETLQKNVLNEVAKVINEEDPALALYAEISLGSARNKRLNQHEFLVSKVKKVTQHGATPKYKQRLFELLPMHVGNANGFIARENCEFRELHFSAGRKTLVYVIKLRNITVVMVHLSLKRRIRKEQFRELSKLVNAIRGPVVVCGDMNIFGGEEELEELTTQTGLHLPKPLPFTYPAFKPRLTLDLFLLRDCEAVEVKALSSKVSDHTPIVLEIK